ncbi:MAG: hypothetical protein Q4D88_04380 [Anaerococcus sp.]|nr:hypothetical protein [Anaerococcus sp.]
MIIIVNLIFLSIIFYNLNKRKQNMYNARVERISILATSFLLALGLIFNWSFDGEMLGYVTALNASLSFFSYLSSAGITSDNFNCRMDTSIFIISIPFDRIDGIRIIENHDKIQVKIKAHSSEYYQEYKLEAKEYIETLAKGLGPF